MLWRISKTLTGCTVVVLVVVTSGVCNTGAQDVPTRRMFLPHRYGYEPYRECPPVELARQFCMRHTASTSTFVTVPVPVQECMRSICPPPHTVVSQFCLWKNFDFCTEYAEATVDRSGPRAIDGVRNCLQRMCDPDRINGISSHRPSTVDQVAIDKCCARGDISPTGCYVMYSHRYMGQIR